MPLPWIKYPSADLPSGQDQPSNPADQPTDQPAPPEDPPPAPTEDKPEQDEPNPDRPDDPGEQEKPLPPADTSPLLDIISDILATANVVDFSMSDLPSDEVLEINEAGGMLENRVAIVKPLLISFAQYMEASDRPAAAKAVAMLWATSVFAHLLAGADTPSMARAATVMAVAAISHACHESKHSARLVAVWSETSYDVGFNQINDDTAARFVKEGYPHIAPGPESPRNGAERKTFREANPDAIYPPLSIGAWKEGRLSARLWWGLIKIANTANYEEWNNKARAIAVRLAGARNDPALGDDPNGYIGVIATAYAIAAAGPKGNFLKMGKTGTTRLDRGTIAGCLAVRYMTSRIPPTPSAVAALTATAAALNEHGVPQS